MKKYSLTQLITFFSGPIGFLFGMIPFLVGFLLGTGIEFDKARASNEFARVIQANNQIVFWILSAILIISVTSFVGYYIYHAKKESLQPEFKNPIIFPYIRIIASLITGYLVYELIIYLLINGIYYHGAFVSIPYLIGKGITFGVSLLILADTEFIALLYQRMTKGKQNIISKQNHPLFYVKIGKNLCVLLLGLIFMIPAIAPMMGVTPNPDLQPETGYGSSDRPYSVTKIRIENQLPEDIASYVFPDNENETWYTYIYLPNLGEETFTIPPQIPIAFYLHGYGGSNQK